MRLRLNRKLSHFIDGVDLSAYSAGDVIELSEHDAALVMAEGWAVPHGSGPTKSHRRLNVSLRGVIGRLRRQLQRVTGSPRQPAATCSCRRFEDLIREELRDNRAITLSKRK
jgi:hypothetical protein